jgi:hypothetical protein
MKVLILLALLGLVATGAAAQPDMHVEDSLANGIPSGGIVAYDLQAAHGDTPTTGQSYTFTIFSTGMAQLDLTGTPAVQVAAGANCSVTPTQPASVNIAAGDDEDFVLLIEPTTDGDFDFTVTIENNTGGSPYTFSVEGVAVTPTTPAQLQISRTGPGVIAHGADDLILSSLGGQLIDLNYTLQNTGTQQLTFSATAVTAVGTHGGPGVVLVAAPTGGSNLAGGATIALDIDVTPSGPGHWMVQVHINSDAVTNPYSFTISGDAGAVPAPFLEVRRGANAIADGGSDTIYGTVDSTMTTLTYDLENIGSAPMTFGTPSVEVTTSTGNPTVGLVGIPGGGTNLAHHSQVAFDVQITPDGAGAWSVTISVNSDGSGGGDHVFTINGNAQAAAAPDIALLRNTGSITNNGTDTITGFTGVVPFVVTYTIRNEGANVLNLTGTPRVQASNPDNCAVVITIQPAAGTVAAAGGTVTFTVQVSPIAAGAFSFDLTIASNDPVDDPFVFTVAGNTGTGSSDEDDDDGGCSTGARDSHLLLVLLLALTLAAALRLRGQARAG